MSAVDDGPPVRRPRGGWQGGLLLRMGAGMAIFVFAGWGLDRLLGTSPWLLLAGTVTGALAILYDLARRAGRKSGRRR